MSEESSSIAIVHERQHRQLCAAHCVNNLLQLSLSDNSNDDRGPLWVENNAGVMERILLDAQPTTKKELDSIADDMTVAEKQLLADNDAVDGKTAPSMLDLLRSNHRTPIMGNYSFEVIETALLRRAVQLTWLSVDDMSQLDFENEHKNVDSDKRDHGNGDVVIGFVINEVYNDSQSFRKRLQRNLSRWLGLGGRHWYAISRIKQSSQMKIQQDHVAHDATWRVLDSESDGILELQSSAELKENLLHVSQNGGSIFKATLLGNGQSETTD